MHSIRYKLKIFYEKPNREFVFDNFHAKCDVINQNKYYDQQGGKKKTLKISDGESFQNVTKLRKFVSIRMRI